MKNKIEQFPKNKIIDFSTLSVEMQQLRINKYIEKYKEGIRCRCCSFLQNKEEFYIKDKNTGRRATKCRDCYLKSIGVIEIGKQRFSKKLFNKNIRVCTLCKSPKSLIDFPKKTKAMGGISNTCRDCSAKVFKEMELKYEGKKTIVSCYVCKNDFLKCNGEIKRTTIHYCSNNCYAKSDLRINNILKT